MVRWWVQNLEINDTFLLLLSCNEFPLNRIGSWCANVKVYPMLMKHLRTWHLVVNAVRTCECRLLPKKQWAMQQIERLVELVAKGIRMPQTPHEIATHANTTERYEGIESNTNPVTIREGMFIADDIDRMEATCL